MSENLQVDSKDFSTKFRRVSNEELNVFHPKADRDMIEYQFNNLADQQTRNSTAGKEHMKMFIKVKDRIKSYFSSDKLPTNSNLTISENGEDRRSKSRKKPEQLNSQKFEDIFPRMELNCQVIIDNLEESKEEQKKEDSSVSSQSIESKEDYEDTPPRWSSQRVLKW